MVGIYFSGTGNTAYCVRKFMREYERTAGAFSIEDEEAVQEICAHREIVMGYPVQFSNIPKILKDFITDHPCIWRNKKIFVIATMGLFSGDGAGMLARLLTRYGAIVTGGLHLKMPDSIGDEKALKRTLAQNQALVLKADRKIERAVQNLKSGNPCQDGIGFFHHLAGLFGQRLYFYHKTEKYSDGLKIDSGKCIRCGRCAQICPMKNISLREGRAVPGGHCTMCYRCINFCPAQAITLFGKKVYGQSRIEKYLQGKTVLFHQNEEGLQTQHVRPNRQEGHMENNTLEFICTGIKNGGKFPIENTGRGQDRSPEFVIRNLSPKAQTLAITLEDLSHPVNNFTHWVIWNIPASRQIRGGIPAGSHLPELGGACQGIGYGFHRYAGPKPPKGKSHTYRFTMYALDCNIQLSVHSLKSSFLKKARGHILQQGSITAQFESQTG